MDRVTFLHIKGYLDDDTEVEIENYSKKRKGWWDSLLDWVGNNENDIEEAAAKKEARLKRQEEQKAKAERKAEAEQRAGEEEKTRAGMTLPRSASAPMRMATVTQANSIW